MNEGSVGGVTAAMKPASAVIGSGLLGGNHATPSFTSAKRSRYAPGTGGAVTVAVIVREVLGSTAASSLVRGPSHRTVLPEASYQWRLRFTGFAPATFQVWLPVFVSATAICALAPAGIVVGGVATAYVAERTATGAARTGVASRRQTRTVAGSVKRARCTWMATTSHRERYLSVASGRSRSG